MRAGRAETLLQYRSRRRLGDARQIIRQDLDARAWHTLHEVSSLRRGRTIRTHQPASRYKTDRISHQPVTERPNVTTSTITSTTTAGHPAVVIVRLRTGPCHLVTLPQRRPHLLATRCAGPSASPPGHHPLRFPDMRPFPSKQASTFLFLLILTIILLAAPVEAFGRCRAVCQAQFVTCMQVYGELLSPSAISTRGWVAAEPVGD